MTAKRQPLSDATAAARCNAQPIEPAVAESRSEAQIWWDAQMAAAGRLHPTTLAPMYPRPMTPAEAKEWLAEREIARTQEQWKPWPTGGIATSEPI